MAEKQNKKQQELAASGYRLPDHFFEEENPLEGQESTEEESGDGGKAAAEIKQGGTPSENKSAKRK